jgi:hypothetical protein
VVDAYFEYVAAHARFDPAKLDLFGYLLMAADRNFRNAQQKESTRRKYENAVELRAPDRNAQVDELAERDERGRRLSLIPGASLQEKVEHILPDPADQRICMLMLKGERKTEAFACALGLSGEAGLIRREVKRRKDRIGKILQRFKRGHDGE